MQIKAVTRTRSYGGDLGKDRHMTDAIDPIDLAHQLARVASESAEPRTASRLMEVVERLLTEAGLPPLSGSRGPAATLGRDHRRSRPAVLHHATR
jgi:hypothetical protein